MISRILIALKETRLSSMLIPASLLLAAGANARAGATGEEPEPTPVRQLFIPQSPKSCDQLSFYKRGYCPAGVFPSEEYTALPETAIYRMEIFNSARVKRFEQYNIRFPALK
jgi:hypothetical protein